MELLKRSALDEKYCHLAIKEFTGLFRGSWGFKSHMQYAKVFSMMVVRV